MAPLVVHLSTFLVVEVKVLNPGRRPDETGLVLLTVLWMPCEGGRFWSNEAHRDQSGREPGNNLDQSGWNLGLHVSRVS